MEILPDDTLKKLIEHFMNPLTTTYKCGDLADINSDIVLALVELQARRDGINFLGAYPGDTPGYMPPAPSVSVTYDPPLPGTPVGVSDGSTASYYELPPGAKELQDLISHRNMNAQIGEIFRSCYRYGLASHSDQLRDAKKMKFYADAEVERLSK